MEEGGRGSRVRGTGKREGEITEREGWRYEGGKRR